ncbi:hypothetical protein HAPAU_10960 [Halalkalicoccus paucihalophilus]|uniref:Uncharacterized protein n=1 Tax=Halalkalicoccus paucihalophilus TaxID=1008153 RepID=A0A151AEB4_9EURY|nr:hypothetical protein [Halalkalicoccus paucihalophilus]KYH26006.1 hypothetical protein HAPAU_10960 [Halalkalicoccus paucihalophilus]
MVEVIFWVFWSLIVFVFLTSAIYVGVLRALDVYFNENEDSLFLSDEPRR